MSDSFEKAMSDVRESIHNFLIASGYYDTMFLPELLGNIDLLETAHKRELEHTKKAEYHRGYVDGTNQRKTETWQLDHDRAEVLARLVNSNFESGSAMRSLGFVLGVDWSRDNTTRSLGKMKARLVYLLGGAVEDSKLQKSPNLEDREYKHRAENATQHNYALELKLHKAERDNRMYRAMLNDAAAEYKKLKHDRDLLMKTLKKVKYDARRLVEHIFGGES